MGRRVQRALLTLAVCFLLGSVVFRECWAGLSVLLGKLQGDAVGNGGGEVVAAAEQLQEGKEEEEEEVVVVVTEAVRNGQWDTQWMSGSNNNAPLQKGRVLARSLAHSPTRPRSRCRQAERRS